MCTDPSGGVDRQLLPRVLIDQREDLNRPAILRSCHHKVPTPEVIAVFRSQTAKIRLP